MNTTTIKGSEKTYNVVFELVGDTWVATPEGLSSCYSGKGATKEVAFRMMEARNNPATADYNLR